MHPFSRLAASVFLLSASVLHAQARSDKYTILYTARTLGYARIPDSQILNQPESTTPNDVAGAYSKMIRDKRTGAAGKPVLVLGMGDNFAPNLFSRTFEVTAAPTGPNAADCLPKQLPTRIPKDQMVYHAGQWVCWQQDGPEQPIDWDNVGQFFIRSGYNAVAVGKHDFYFGPERLKKLADYLEKHGVSMLASNLIVTTTRAATFNNAYPRIPDAYANPPFSTDFGPSSVDLPDAVLPWKQRFVVKGAISANGTELIDKDNTYICHEEGSSTSSLPWKVPRPPDKNCAPLVTTEAACMGATPATKFRGDNRIISMCKQLDQEKHISEVDAKPLFPVEAAAKKAPSSGPSDLTFLFADHDGSLKAGLNHLFCTYLKNQQNQRPSGDNKDKTGARIWTCQPFSVQVPFFGDHSPYKVICGDGAASGQCVAVFGVVDPDLLNNVGMLNDGWLNQNHKLDTVASVAAVDYSLKQALDFCFIDERCQAASKVLMAQTSPARSAALISAFRKAFDVVISQADPEKRTADITLQQTTPSTDHPETWRPQFLLIPADPTLTQDDTWFNVQIAQADVSRWPGGVAGAWTLTNHVFSNPVGLKRPSCPGSTCSTLSDLSKRTLTQLKIPFPPQVKPQPSDPPTNPAAPFQDLVLSVMRQRSGSQCRNQQRIDNGDCKEDRAVRDTDMAFLQTRDLYSADIQTDIPVSPAQLQEQIDRIIWKGDFLTTLHVTGATIKKLYKQSQKFAALDHNALSTEVEHGRDLVTLGLFKDPLEDDSYYVNGVKMDDTALYTIAATDFIAAGDTGYADLATADVPPAVRIKDYKTLRMISGLVCEAIAENASGFETAPCHQKADAKYFDPSTEKPFDGTPGFDTAQHLFHTFLGRLTHSPDMPDQGAEHTAQQRKYWTLSLENMDFTFSGTFINHIATASTTFAGISTTGVTTLGSTTYGADHKLRLIYDFGPGTFYWLNDSAVLRNTLTTGSAPPSIAQNVLGYESGGTLRVTQFMPHQSHRPYWISAQYSARYEGQITQPSPSQITYAPLPGEPAEPLSLANLRTPKSGTLYGRIGARIEHADTYFESGFEEADARNVLSDYLFPDGALCKPTAVQEFLCATKSSGQTAINALSELFATGTAPPTPLKSSYLNAGVYVNFNIKIPIISRQDQNGADQSYYFVLTNRGDWFKGSPSDTTVQTRYLDKLSPSLNFPIYGKLLLTPRVDIILYENKVYHNHFQAVEPSVSLSYSFKWRPGMRFRKAVGYGAIATTPPISIPPP